MRGRATVVIATLVVLLALVVAASLVIGVAQTSAAVVMEIRAPRVALAVTVGVGLGLSGALLQGTLRNPLADPGIIGISGGAALGAVAVVAVGAAYGSVVAAVGATVAGLAAMWLVSWISRTASGRSDVTTLVLGGVAITAFSAAVLSVVVALSGAAGVRSATFWTTGSLALSTWPGFWATVPFVVMGIFGASLVSGSLDVLALGDRAAYSAGIDVERVRLVALASAVVLVAAGVAVVGVIAFVGLVVPHLVRLLMGPNHRPLLIGSALAGALLLLVADTIARTVVAPVELPIGVVTAVIGAPVFIYLLRRSQVAVP